MDNEINEYDNQNQELIDFEPEIDSKKFELLFSYIIPEYQKIYNYDEVKFELYDKLSKKYNDPQEVNFQLEKELDFLKIYFDVDASGNFIKKKQFDLRSEDVRDSLYNHNVPYVSILLYGIHKDYELLKKKWLPKVSKSEIKKSIEEHYFFEQEKYDLTYKLDNYQYVECYFVQDENSYIKYEMFLESNANNEANSQKKNIYESIYNYFSEKKKDGVIRKYRIYGSIPWVKDFKNKYNIVYNVKQEPWIESEKAKLINLLEKTNIHKTDNNPDTNVFNNYFAKINNNLYARIKETYGNVFDVYTFNVKEDEFADEVYYGENIEKIYDVPHITKKDIYIGESYTFLYKNKKKKKYELLSARLVDVLNYDKKKTTKKSKEPSKKLNKEKLFDPQYVQTQSGDIIRKKMSSNNGLQTITIEKKDKNGQLKSKKTIQNRIPTLIKTETRELDNGEFEIREDYDDGTYIIKESFSDEDFYGKSYYVQKYSKDGTPIGEKSIIKPSYDGGAPPNDESEYSDSDINKGYNIDIDNVDYSRDATKFLYSEKKQSVKYDSEGSLNTHDSDFDNSILVFNRNGDEYYISFINFQYIYLYASVFVSIVHNMKDKDLIVYKNNFYFLDKTDKPNVTDIIRSRDKVFRIYRDIIIDNIKKREEVEIYFRDIQDYVPQINNWKDILRLSIIQNDTSNEIYKNLPTLFQLCSYMDGYRKTSKDKKSILINDLEMLNYLYQYSYHQPYAYSQSLLNYLYKHNSYEYIKNYLKKNKSTIYLKPRLISQQSKDKINESKSKNTAKILVKNILSITNIVKRNEILKKFIDNYCFLIQNKDKKWWYSIVDESSNQIIELLCIHVKYEVENDKKQLSELVNISEDGYRVCSNCGECLEYVAFDTFEGFEATTDKLDLFREQGRLMSSGVEVAGTGDVNLSTMFTSINIQKHQEPPILNNESQLDIIDRNLYGQVDGHYVVDIFYNMLSELTNQYDNLIIRENELLKANSDWDNYIRYIQQNIETRSLNIDSEIKEGQSIQDNEAVKEYIEKKNLLKSKGSINPEINELEIRYNQLQKELKSLKEKYTDPKESEGSKKIIKQEYDTKYKLYKQLSQDIDAKKQKFTSDLKNQILILSRNPVVIEYIELYDLKKELKKQKTNKLLQMEISLLVGLKYWLLSFYQNKNKTPEEIQLEIENDYPIIKQNETLFKAYEKILIQHQSINNWIGRYNNNQMSRASQIALEDYSEDIKNKSLEELSGTPITQKTTLAKFKTFNDDGKCYFIISPLVEDYMGYIDWNKLNEKLKYITDKYFSIPDSSDQVMSQENAKKLYEANEYYRKQMMKWKDWFFQSHRFNLCPHFIKEDPYSYSFEYLKNWYLLNVSNTENISNMNIGQLLKKYELYNYLYKYRTDPIIKSLYYLYQKEGLSFDDFVRKFVKENNLPYTNIIRSVGDDGLQQKVEIRIFEDTKMMTIKDRSHYIEFNLIRNENIKLFMYQLTTLNFENIRQRHLTLYDYILKMYNIMYSENKKWKDITLIENTQWTTKQNFERMWNDRYRMDKRKVQKIKFDKDGEPIIVEENIESNWQYYLFLKRQFFDFLRFFQTLTNKSKDEYLEEIKKTYHLELYPSTKIEDKKSYSEFVDKKLEYYNLLDDIFHNKNIKNPFQLFIDNGIDSLSNIFDTIEIIDYKELIDYFENKQIELNIPSDEKINFQEIEKGELYLLLIQNFTNLFFVHFFSQNNLFDEFDILNELPNIIDIDNFYQENVDLIAEMKVKIFLFYYANQLKFNKLLDVTGDIAYADIYKKIGDISIAPKSSLYGLTNQERKLQLININDVTFKKNEQPEPVTETNENEWLDEQQVGQEMDNMYAYDRADFDLAGPLGHEFEQDEYVVDYNYDGENEDS